MNFTKFIELTLVEGDNIFIDKNKITCFYNSSETTSSVYIVLDNNTRVLVKETIEQIYNKM